MRMLYSWEEEMKNGTNKSKKKVQIEEGKREEEGGREYVPK